MNSLLWSLALSCLLAPPVKKSDEATTHLYVRTSPTGAEIVLDGKSLGKSPGVFPVEPGTGNRPHRLVIELDGHLAEDQEITIRNGRVTRIEITLKPRPNRSTNLPDPFQRIKIGKKVSDFPEPVDLSTPESAWAAYTRASSGKDAQGVVDLSWVQIDPREMETFWTKGDHQDMAIYNKAQLDSELIDLIVYREKLAMAISKLEFPPGVGRHPYSSRTFGLINGEWKNLGEDRCPSLGVAVATFVRKSGVLWQGYRKIAEELAENERDAATLLEKKARSIADKSLSFGPVVERSMTLPGKGKPIGKEMPTFEFLNVETGELIKLKASGPNQRYLHTQIRRNKVDLAGGVEHGTTPGVLLFDAIMKDIPSERWDSITPGEVVDILHLKSNEPQLIAKLVRKDGAKLPVTCVFETREGTQGMLQLVGTDDAKTAKIRYKVVKAAKTASGCQTDTTKPAPTNISRPET